MKTKSAIPQYPVEFSPDEARSIFIALSLEKDRYKGYEYQMRTYDMKALYEAWNKFWYRVQAIIHPEKPCDPDNEAFTILELKMMYLTAAVELGRYRDVPRHRWTSDLLGLSAIHDKIVATVATLEPAYDPKFPPPGAA
jgi:hypothetical protein